MKDYNCRLKKLEEKKHITSEKEDLCERVKEVERIFENFEKEYNSDQERQKRAAEYAEIQRIGELRKQAYLNGEKMDKYPLPFDNTNDEMPEELRAFLT